MTATVRVALLIDRSDTVMSLMLGNNAACTCTSMRRSTLCLRPVRLRLIFSSFSGVLAVNSIPFLPFLQSKVVYLVFRFFIILLMPCLVVAPFLYLFLKCLVMKGYFFPCNLLQANIFSEGEKAGFSGWLSTSWTIGVINNLKSISCLFYNIKQNS